MTHTIDIPAACYTTQMRKPPRNRHIIGHIDKKLIISDEILDVLQTLDPYDRYHTLPRNWFQQFAPINPRTGKPWHWEWFRHRVGPLTCTWQNVKYPLLGRTTLNDDERNEEMLKYFLTNAGKRLLAENHRLPLTYEPTPEPPKHRLFSQLRHASLEIGIRSDPRFSLNNPADILAHPGMGDFDPQHPFKFQLPDGRTYDPDDKPLVLRRADNKARLLIFEDDRNTMGTLKKKEGSDTRRLHEKFEKIKSVWDLRLFERKYGIANKAALLIFSTTTELRARNVKEYLENTFGRMPYVCITWYPTFQKLHKTIPVTTQGFDGTYIRPGCPDFSLKTLSEV